MSTGQISYQLEQHIGHVSTALFCPQDRVVLTASHDLKCYIWDFKAACIQFELIGHQLTVNCAVFNQSGNVV